ncbi:MULTISPECIES: Gfo/Idh/MocA family protein [Paenibacillus]|uniref:Gfo/Idh/MocA family protein n=1 Tax=Paenibacillus TaxID=44249 RepID=UPI001C8EBA48|nr:MULTISPECIES: Gfo/Idh/MocA family oxidoreductase [Paenibacillus]MBY0215980.1 Gfo/Idh/MocA family oxidoreductase [Paenibacillus illinoisensis]MCM3204191.1 Gfo/Idh/MocA family oxidoreductase [Paenibacillus illinoisensis]WJH31152.1 Gfo/Idh/MocA family oxidoreductase [Paenibacillus sp. CC-CFT742]
MLKVGLIGFGFMGRMHFDNYVRLASEGEPVELVAICDLRIEELKNGKAAGNMATEQEVYDLTPYRLYDNIDAMLEQEELDIIDITLPTPLHAELTCSLLERGYHVLCEKPVARHSAEGWKMAQTAKETGKTLMIGQCLRFWPAYAYLKSVVEDGRYGAVNAGYFFRGSGLPQEWFLDGEKSGGCILDMHIHDADMIHWVFGKPDQVSTLARNVIPGSGYDTVSTNYVYPDGKVLNAQADWTLGGDYGFSMTYRVNLEQGNLVFENGDLKVNPNNAPGFVAELSPDSGYYYQIRYFIRAIAEETPITVCTPESAIGSLEIIEAEMRSADEHGALVSVD